MGADVNTANEQPIEWGEGFAGRVLAASRVRPLAVTVETAKCLIGVGNTTLWKLIKEKKLRTARVGARTLIIYESIEELLGITAATKDQAE